jgi:hypothetical protein
MRRTERVREVVSGPLESTDLQQRTAGGWKLVAIEWEREVETADDQPLAEVPFGLRIAPQTLRLEQNPAERKILLQSMELIVQEGSYAHIADEINRRGLRAREGEKWTPVSVFEILPRLIEVWPAVVSKRGMAESPAVHCERRAHIGEDDRFVTGERITSNSETSGLGARLFLRSGNQSVCGKCAGTWYKTSLDQPKHRAEMQYFLA